MLQQNAIYIKQVEVDNIRSLDHVEWNNPSDEFAGWHVIIGDNGSGKSSLLQAIALALIGKSEAGALRLDWRGWLPEGKTTGDIKVTLSNKKKLRLRFNRNEQTVSLEDLEGKASKDSGLRKFFSASYGPFRRFKGGGEEYRRTFISNPIPAAHLSLFGEDVALTEYSKWLQDLKFKTLEQSLDENHLDDIIDLINEEGLLPNGVRLEDITSEGVIFSDAEGQSVSVENLSDGYRSILSMTFELIRQMLSFFERDEVFGQSGDIVAPGIVLIDEVDAHLHPTWQRQIGSWFTTHFPQVQFFITTHSPLVCQAVDLASVFRLPKPGSNELPGMITGIALDRLRYGNVLDAYGTEVFGRGITRSNESKEKMIELAELNRKELNQDLTVEERDRQQELRATFPTSAHTLNTENSQEAEHE